MLAYTNLEQNSVEEITAADWRRNGPNTRNITAGNTLNGDSAKGDAQPGSLAGKLLETNPSLKRNDIKDPLKSVK